MVVCTGCGKPIPDGEKCCGACGASILPAAESATGDLSASAAPTASLAVSKSMSPRHKGDWSAWVAFAVVVCIFVLNATISNVEYDVALSSAVAIALGATIVPVVIGGGIGYLAGRGSGTPVVGFVAGTVIVFFMATMGSFDGLRRHEETRQQTAEAVKGIREDLKSVIAAPSDAGKLQSRSAVAPGEFGELQKFLRAVMTRFASFQDGYSRELDEIGWATILSADRIKKDSSLRESKSMVEKAKLIVAKYDRKCQSAFNGLEAEINALPVSEALKADTLRGFKKSMAQNGNVLAEQWRLETQTIQEFDKIVSLLAATKDWHVEEGTIVFKRTEESSRFNAYLDAIDNLTKQEKELQKSSVARASALVESMK